MGLSQTPQALVPAEFTSGGMTLLASGTLSGASVTLSSISQNFINLYLIIYNVAGGGSNARIYPNGTSNITGSNFVSFNNITGNNLASTYIKLWGNGGFSGSSNAGFINILNYANTTFRKPIQYSCVHGTLGNNEHTVLGAGGFYTNSAITSLEIVADSSTFSAGNYLLYGVK